jgi:soluble lytic murein transglycosylase-like protein
VTWFLFAFLMQDVRAQAERIRSAMEESLSKQRASVRRQQETVTAQQPVRVTSEPACDPIPGPAMDSMIDDAARKQGVDAALVREVARQESGFRPCAVSVKGAEGLMQLMPATQAQFQVRDPFDAQQSLEAGTKLLKQLLDRFHGDIALALSAYNAGAGRVERAGGVPEIPETKNYVADILGRILP